MLFELAKKSNFLQNLVVNLVSGIHPTIDHNIGKIQMLKKAMFHCELELIEGSYFEFGVFEGTSLLAAIKSHEKLNSKIKRNFYGFDSFEDGFKYFDERDKHPFFKEGDFVSSFDKANKRLKKYSNAKLIKGYFEETVAGKPTSAICGNDKCAIVFIDCDLMHPTTVALDFLKPILQPGSVIILDDYWAYKGSTDLGTAGALKKFVAENPGLSVREFFTYGVGGKSFIVETI